MSTALNLGDTWSTRLDFGRPKVERRAAMPGATASKRVQTASPQMLLPFGFGFALVGAVVGAAYGPPAKLT